MCGECVESSVCGEFRVWRVSCVVSAVCGVPCVECRVLRVPCVESALFGEGHVW